MPGRKSDSPLNWSILYELCADSRVAPGDRGQVAIRRGIDRSAVQVERYLVAVDLVNRYHATDLINLRAVSDRVWAELEQQLLEDVEAEVVSTHPDTAYLERDRILSQVTRPMLERAAAGWHAWEAAQPVPAEAQPRPGLASPPWRWVGGVVLAVAVVGAGLSLGFLRRALPVSVTYVGPLPESYINLSEMPRGHSFVGYRFRVQGERLPTLTPENVGQVIMGPPACPSTGFGFDVPGSFDLFLYCATDMAPGRYRFGVRLPDGRGAETSFSHVAQVR